MKYNININQFALAGHGIDLIDCAILDYLYDYCNSQNGKIKSKRDENGMTWVSYSAIMDDLPLINIKSKGAISGRIKKIETAGFIKCDLKSDGRLYVSITEKFDLTKFSTVRLKERDRSFKRTPPFTQENGTVHLKERIIYTNNNSHDDNKNDDTKNSNDVAFVIKLFEKLDVKNKKYYGNKTQRANAKILIDEYGIEKVSKLIDVYLKVRGDKFLPSISSPYDMVEKMSKLEDFFLRKKADVDELKNRVVWCN